MKTSTTTEERSKNILNAIDEMVIKSIAQVNFDTLWGDIQPQIEQKFIETFGFIPEVHKVETPTFSGQFTGVTHEKFDDVLALVNCDIPVLLVGPAGTGKSCICKQVAEGLGLDFYFSNAITQEFKITGFQDANGVYRDTQFFNAFTKGGLFFLDELDASIPEVLVILNAAIANRYFDFPGHGRVEAHPNFRVIAAANTTGTGADSTYTGRFCLDGASLDRFAMLNIDYSPKIEKAVTDGNEELIKFAHEFRKVTEKAGIQCIFSYRSMQRIAKLEGIIKSLPELLKIALTKGLEKDDRNIIYTELSKKLSGNKYVNAFKDIK